MKPTLLALLVSTAMLTLTGCTVEEYHHPRHYGYDNGYYDRGYSRYDDGYYNSGYRHRSATVVVEPRVSTYRRDVYVAHPDVRRSNHVYARSNATVYRQPSATVVVTDKKKKKHHDHD
jgi:hypothetical protein